MTRTSMGISLVPPTGRTERSCKTRSNFTCMASVISLISSRKMVPPPATSNSPRLFCVAPVSAPFKYPKSSLSDLQLHLHGQRHLADFIEEDGAAAGHFE